MVRTVSVLLRSLYRALWNRTPWIEGQSLTFRLSCSMTCTRPGVSRCINGLVASGVTSLGVKPVPPAIMMQLSYQLWKHLQESKKKPTTEKQNKMVNTESKNHRGQLWEFMMFSSDVRRQHTTQSHGHSLLKLDLEAKLREELVREEEEEGEGARPVVRMRCKWSLSLHWRSFSWIAGTLSGTTAVATTVAPPRLSDTLFTTSTALGPLPTTNKPNLVSVNVPTT